MIYLFDTDHISFLQRRTGPEYATLSLKVARFNPDDFAFSVISFHEQTLGAHNLVIRARSSADVMRGYTLFDEILRSYSATTALPYDPPAAANFDTLKLAKIRVPTMDLRLAAIALSNRLILLTRNSKDFSKVPGLMIEDWTI